MYTKKHTFTLFIILSVLVLSSCSEVKKVAYFQNYGTSADSAKLQKTSINLYDARIKPKDLLSITVVTSEPEATRNYNLVAPLLFDPTATATAISSTSAPTVQTYLVDNEGIINFPTIGKIKVAGLTRNELETKLQEKLAFAFNKELPIITIRIANYSVNIVGEVSRPGKYVTVNDRMTIFESLAMAGDMTIYGRRDNVKVLRENADGTKKIISINLNDKNIIYSPAYYLEQNDVVYIEPNSAKSRSSNIGAEETLTISALSIVISLTSLLVNILK